MMSESKKIQVLIDDISSLELIKLAEASGSFDWLSSEDDVYTIEDGEEFVYRMSRNHNFTKLWKFSKVFVQ